MSDITDMAVFVRVADLGSFSWAGRELRLTPAAVTKRIAKLERRLGVRLFNRTTRKVQLTEEGSTYYDHCVRILKDIEWAESAIAADGAKPRGFIKVTAPTLFGRMWIAPLIPKFIDAYPELRVHLQLTDRLVNLLDEGFDVAVRNADLKDSSLIAHKLASDRRVVCATPAYFAKMGTPETPDDLLTHRCLLLRFPGTQQYRWYFEGPNGRLAVPVKGHMDSNSSDVLYQWTLAGHGLSLRSTAEVDDDLRSGRLAPVLTRFIPRDTAFYAVYPHRRLLPSKIKAFVNFLCDNLGPEPIRDRDLPIV